MTGSVAGVLRNLGLFAISLVLAVVVWVVAVNEDNPLEERIVPRAIPVEVTGLQANVMVLGGLATEATVTLRAPRLTWPTLAINKLRVVADVTQWQSGSQVVTLRGVFPDQQAEVVVIEPPVVTLQLARVVTRTLPVRVRIIGDPAIGYTFGSPVLSVVDATISGRPPILPGPASAAGRSPESARVRRQSAPSAWRRAVPLRFAHRVRTMHRSRRARAESLVLRCAQAPHSH